MSAQSTLHDSRIQLLARDEAPAHLHPLYDRADALMTGEELPGPTLFGNQIRALAHNPDLLEALVNVYQVFAETQSVDRKLMELGILVVSRLNACEYCVQHHAPNAHDAGLTRSQLQAIQAGDWASRRELWDDEEWLVIQYAAQITEAPYRISDTFFAELKEHFTERQIVDLTMRLALCSAWNKFNDALELDTESPIQHAFAELGLEMA